ncbi:DNA polymerase epsilon subunit 4 [Leptinotarsa decemlineata]|uniref:DNA polymerase epsilon subunit 4 n=1 Tax=Leptinotarsa decemlineata TaxID=7539 RepID=UPI000C252A39|nr:DNA polymerase epsilon subunit 4 [Leptinotarsa decemlineata]
MEVSTGNDIENINVDVEHLDESSPEKETPTSLKENPSPKHKFLRLPLARVKAMMKMDPNCTVISQDSVFLVTKATEMFIEYLAKEAAKPVITGKRKTMMKKDVDSAIGAIPHLCFLEGAIE